jgi:hypothetical protein
MEKACRDLILAVVLAFGVVLWLKPNKYMG